MSDERAEGSSKNHSPGKHTRKGQRKALTDENALGVSATGVLIYTIWRER